MIDKKENKECCGCGACQNKCPQNAITMVEDSKYGFKYPRINKEKCNGCNLCDKVCVTKKRKDNNDKPLAYACINKNTNIRNQSSSGGIFTLLANVIIENNGVVFGAVFDKSFNVIHSYVESKANLYKIRGSKYVQSDILDSYKKAEMFLKEDRYVLFTGTPCQIEALYSYLGKEYNKLYTQDIICHGVPSPKVWKKYLEYIKGDHKEIIKEINFRDKSKSWEEYNMHLKFSNSNYTIHHNQDPYMQLFLKDISLRDSCYDCKFKGKNRRANITLADLWGIDNIVPMMNDSIGTSLVIINNDKGKELFKQLSDFMNYQKIELELAMKYNPSMIESSKLPELREAFFNDCDILSFKKIAKKYLNKNNYIVKIKKIIKNVFIK